MKSLRCLLKRWLNQEKGIASVEFVIVVPILMTIFTASAESGVMMTRQVLLDRALDMTVRELRLGHLNGADADTLRAAVCANSSILKGCLDTLTVELRRVDRANFVLPAPNAVCVNRNADYSPVVDMPLLPLDGGVSNDLMLVRVCARADAMFRSSTYGLQVSLDPMGGYRLSSTSAFVIEPQ